jgi:hypothetical protein
MITDVYIVIHSIALPLYMPSSVRNKTVIRSIRISKELDGILQKDARTKRISINSLIGSIMAKYAEMDRYNERYDTITLKQESFSSIIQVVEDDKLIEVAKEIGSLIPKQFLLFWFKRADLETFLKYLSLVCNYNGFGKHEVDIDDSRTNYTITIIHSMGHKWSNFLKIWLEQGMNTITSIIPKVDVSKNTVVARFHVS